jgi:hypothetical protein
MAVRLLIQLLFLSSLASDLVLNLVSLNKPGAISLGAAPRSHLAS